MKKRLYFISLAAIILTFIGCMPEDEPLTPLFVDSTTMRQSVSMGSLYGTQLYYSLKTKSIVRSQPITTWHIGFSCERDKATVILNSALFMRLCEVKSTTPFEEVTKVPEIPEREWRYDKPILVEDSTALGKWYKKEGSTYTFNKSVFIVDLGNDDIGKKLGFRKIQFVDITDNTYTLRVAELNNKNDTTITIQKDSEYQFIHLNVQAKCKVVVGEPKRNEWDLLFTRYTYIFYEPEYTAYSVTGVMINTPKISVWKDSAGSFDKVTRNEAQSYSYKNDRDVIGYDWKYFDLENNKFILDHRRTYVLKTNEGFYYVLRFMDFYDEKGVKGTVTYEVKSL